MKIHKQPTLADSKETVSIDITNINQGVYFIKSIINNQSFTKQFIKK